MRPDFQSSGSIPLSKDLLKTIDRGTHNRSAHCLKTSADHPSGPGDLPVLRETNFSNTTDGSMAILDNEVSSLLST